MNVQCTSVRVFLRLSNTPSKFSNSRLLRTDPRILFIRTKRYKWNIANICCHGIIAWWLMSNWFRLYASNITFKWAFRFSERLRCPRSNGCQKCKMYSSSYRLTHTTRFLFAKPHGELKYRFNHVDVTVVFAPFLLQNARKNQLVLRRLRIFSKGFLLQMYADRKWPETPLHEDKQIRRWKHTKSD